MMDKDGNGRISFPEFEAMYNPVAMPPEQVEQLWRAADRDGSGCLDRDEVYRLMEGIRKREGKPEPLTRDFVQKMFKMMDKDGNGRISYEEFEAVYNPGVMARKGGAPASGGAPKAATTGSAGPVTMPP